MDPCRPAALFSLLLAAASSPAYAQSAEDTDIIVTGAPLPDALGTPAYGSVTIDADRLQSIASGRIEAALTDVAGFQQFRRSDSRSANPSAQGATLRALGGNAASRTLVLLDGVPQSDPFFGYIPFSALVPEQLDRVTVTRGSGAGAFGAGAVAGVIAMDSAVPTKAAVHVTALGGSADARELSVSGSALLGGGFVTVGLRHDRGDGFFTVPDAARTAADVRAAYAGWSGQLRAVAPLSDTAELQASVRLFDDARTLRFAGADSTSRGQDASIRLITRGEWQVEALAYVQLRNFTNVVISATSLRKTLDQRDTPSMGLGGKIELRPPVGASRTLRLGMDVRHVDGELYEDAYSGVTGLVTARRNAGGQQRVAGAFAEADWRLGRLTLTGGARGDRWTISQGFFDERLASGGISRADRFANRSGTEWTARGGAVWRGSDAVQLRAAAYTGFRLPTLNELYRPFVVFPVTTRANAALAPERLRGAEVGAELTPSPTLRLGATLFVNRLGGAIANVTTGVNQRERQNVGAIVARGVELTGAWRSGPLSLTGSYAFSDSRVRARGTPLDGLRPAQSARHMASATSAWRAASGLELATTLRYVGAQFEDDLQTDRLPDALTLDATARVPLGHGMSIIARGENLFDAAIITRKVGTSIDLGTPRTLWLGLRWAG